MFKLLKWLITVVIIGFLVLTAALYGLLSLSLPKLDGKHASDAVAADVSIARDALGQVVIDAKTRADAAYALGFAHGQDRLFQMDLLRRSAAGELSELFGKAALNLDRRMRFHQFRARSESIVEQLPEHHKYALQAYSKGVNEARSQISFDSFEYQLTGAPIVPWQPADSILVIFAMYLDLQAGNFQRDQVLIQLDSLFGAPMRLFLTQPSQYQAALDGSKLPQIDMIPPNLEGMVKQVRAQAISSQPQYGSNNWAVTGELTHSNKAMLSDDMHLGLNVPAIWYRAQLNYQHNDQPYQVTGVSLPGAPAIVVGSNNQVAWGFTNGYLDTADWIELNEQTRTWQVTEHIALPDGQSEQYKLLMSDYGPVKSFNGMQYALSWVAHQPYAVNLNLLEFERASSVDDAMRLAPEVGIPVQNLMIVDALGHAGWQPIGAIPSRTTPSDIAVKEADYSPLWQKNELRRPRVANPEQHRLWTANARVVSTSEHLRFGDGGYALGARAQQIRDRLYAKQQFTEQDFNQLQQDNEARFLTPWHSHLTQLLSQAPQSQYSNELAFLESWQGCACPESVGYTLVKHFRAALIDEVFAPVEAMMLQHDTSLSHIKRYFEPALWQLLKHKPPSWLNGHESWQALQLHAFEQATLELTNKHGSDIAAWQWGKVNALKVRHPFSQQIPILSGFLDMPTMPAFGDTFMPAVQKPSFGASQRFVAQPGALENAIMTIAGGQSGHPLSSFYRTGFKAYAQGEATPLLPMTTIHKLVITAKK
ncbi:Acyl-homoserine lactone acylase QuiP [Pseudoalteromonas sp. CIP111854]|uniref:Acyl-homoserine lactone acylase QuiP n=1 Tax=Pseudoalteromonas holothuriae TaxID=2963714 RepID=A0A9W4R4B5_9GAMM|nr:penicillin acylase family protein [Pseudoalteromonas sp. CIP111854]CAH9065471.1 Acyl-homoserine lactone acylase QuiP [Pseudoalteromonas sp. CIP111854]